MDADASTLRMELMHEAEKQGVVHHFLSLFFRTPTAARFSSAGAARVGVGLPGRPCCIVNPRQQGLEFPVPAPPLLAWAFPQGLVSSSSHANTARNFPCRRRLCWRGPSRKALFHRRSAPTGARFSRSGVARVGVGFLQGLVAPSSHANRSWIFLRPALLPKD